MRITTLSRANQLSIDIFPLKRPHLTSQQPMPVVGFLRSTPATGFAYVDPFRQGLVEGKNVAIEYRWADPARSATGTGGRSPAQASRRDRRGRRSGGAGRQSRNGDDADRIRHWSRPGQSWSGRKHQPAGRQYHGCRLFRCPVGGQAARDAARVGSQGVNHRRVARPKRS
jgi:hypothetical protein